MGRSTTPPRVVEDVPGATRRSLPAVGDRIRSRHRLPEAESGTSCMMRARFTIQQESILGLFTGETFYSSIDASIREAVLNAIDAVGRQQDADPSLSVEITVKFDRQSRTVTVADNGDGMGKAEVTQLFTKIGSSAATITTAAKDGKYRAVGEFGIGVLSYFLTCQDFELHSLRAGDEPIGLKFSRDMLDGHTQALPIEPRQTTQGTELVLSVKTEKYFSHLVERFPYWVRHVDGLSAKEYPGGTEVRQGGLSREIKTIDISAPEWIHKTAVGPPVLFDSWDKFDGSAHVDVLYRGVFVDTVSIDGLWAIAGAIHVDPKRFRPKLNREGFVGDTLKVELEPVLRAAHPLVLERAIECVRDVLGGERTKHWTLDRWVTLWLAVPRSGAYTRAATLWDSDFRTRKAFRLLGPAQKDEDVSVQDLVDLGAKELYVAPLNLQATDQITQQAVRVLRNSGRPVVQGISRDSNFLAGASLVGASTGDLLVNHFRSELPTLVSVEQVAASVIRQETAVSVFQDPPNVKLVRLGSNATPVVPVGEEIWINLDCDAGRKILEEICRRNEGHLGLWAACMKHAGQYAQQIANILVASPTVVNKLGPVKRAFLRSLAK